MRLSFFKLMLVCLLSLLSACATQANRDPLEGFNRGVYKFNDVTDKALLKPIAGAYKAIIPSPLRTGVNNFFSNISTVISTLNNLLQFKFTNAFTEAGRFVINTTFGIAGIFDVASMDNVPKHKADFGQTLGHWGLGSGAYMVIPFIGPSSVRDAIGLAGDFVVDPLGYPRSADQIRTSNQLFGAWYLDKRASFLDASDLLDNASFDPYAFMRDAYLQHREAMVRDGDVSKETTNQQDNFDDAMPKNGTTGSQ